MNLRLPLLLLATVTPALGAREYHVAPAGNNTHDGSAAQPLQTISAAAKLRSQ